MARFSDVFAPKSQTILGTFTAGDLEVDSTTLSVDATNDRVGMGLTDPKTRLTVEGAVTLKEQASADADTAAYGQIWVKTATPNQLYFTDDAGTDVQLGAAASGDITAVTAGVGLSGGGSSGGVTLTLDLSELSTVTPANGDFLATLDSDGANEQKTTTTALATLFAGTGLTASSSVIGVDASQTQITAVGTITTGAWNGSAIGTTYITDNAVTLAKMAGLARGGLIIGDASGDPTALSVGSDNHVLTVDSNGDIGWESAAGGAVDLNGLSAATVDVAADSIGVIDANDGNASRKESIVDLATAMAGTGVTATNGVFSLDVSASATGLAAGNALPGGAASSADQIIAIQAFS